MKPGPILALALLAALACSKVSPDQARRLVARYNEVVSEAYRRNDIRLIDPVVGPDTADGRRLTGLIGARMDMGIALDAHLEALVVRSVEQGPEQLRVVTGEDWRYRDLQVATGRQVGEASVDHYEMIYLFRKVKGAWLVSETKFAAPPQVGRKAAPWSLDSKDAHGMMRPSAPEGRQP